MKLAARERRREQPKVEAAGIEPASRDISMKASTCVVDYLNLANARSNRQDRVSASQEQSLAKSVLDSDSRRVGFSDRLLCLSDEGPQPGSPIY